MLIVTATMHPHGSPTGAYEVMHGTITNTSPAGMQMETYATHFLFRPRKEAGIIGFEADAEVRGYNRRLGFAPLLSSVLAAMDPVPLDYEPEIDLQAKLTLREMDEFDARLRGRT